MPSRIVVFTAAIVITLVAACGDDPVSAPEQTVFGSADRQVKLRVPPEYDHSKATPLLLVLHGYGANGLIQLGFSQLGDAPALILAPNGTTNTADIQFWNATDACCDFNGSGVDDVAYLGALIDEVRAVYNVDQRRIYIWGHSNGGFMAYRMACEQSTKIAAIVSLAGASFLQSEDCNPSEPVSVLQVHGDADETILFAGGSDCVGFDCSYPSAEQSLRHWAGYDECDDTRSGSEMLDLDSSIPGDETIVDAHQACPTGIDVELWRIQGGGHIPTLNDNAGDAFWAWLEAHPKP